MAYNATIYLPSCCSRHGDLTPLLRRLSHRINQAVQVHCRLEGGIAWGDVARANRSGKARIELANIVRRTLRHILGHVVIARGNFQRLKIPTGACPREMDSTELRGLSRRGHEGALAPVDFETIATASPGKARHMD